ncbi:DUF4124 domain-containing protein [Thermomonas sp.]|uniref:DUF4124 domain-containing protein n=1 Tax=Thermomonas sp. TaxID=1971895 RepID=UPI001DB96DA4|nr:DUF4124 domain-containing protein [Thermomonas sp.]MBZ0088139.1 DUF4124 domain-containing protein [Thermomonas sp.]MCO5055319.1 DUF4124 domain-containing protein [Thermomonas sp.]HRO62433.1 DUF4124 domain-containing protein [Thermomonas sp.]
MTLFRTLALALGITLVATPLLAQQRIYQRKDANGVSQYTDVRPESQYTVRNVNNSGTPAPTAAPAAAESAQCKGVRNNLSRLQSTEAIGIDTNGDGKPDRNLSADERKAQVELNQAAVKAYCPPAADQ